MVLLSTLAFLCPPTWLHDENVDCPHLYHVIMGSYTLIVGVLKYILFWAFCPLWFLSFGVLSYGAFIHFGFSLSEHVITWRKCWLSTPVSCDHGIVHLDCWSIKIFSLLGVWSDLIFILWGFCPMVLLSILAFLYPPTWSHDENVDSPQLYHVIMGSYTLIGGVLKYFLFWLFCKLWFFSFAAFLIWWFCPFWRFYVYPHDRMMRMLIVHTCIMWSLNCTPWLLISYNIFSFRGFLCFDFYPFRLCPMVLLSILAFLCLPTWSHDENVGCPQLYHVIMGSYNFIVGVLKYFLIWSFCLLWILSFGAFVLWCFCPFWLFSVNPHDRMKRMLIVHTCIMWSYDHTPWLLEY